MNMDLLDFFDKCNLLSNHQMKRTILIVIFSDLHSVRFLTNFAIIKSTLKCSLKIATYYT